MARHQLSTRQSRDEYVYKVTCLGSYINRSFWVTKVKDAYLIKRNDKISMKNIISGKMILAVWKGVFQESILEMKMVFKLNMSRTIDVLSEPDSNSDHRNNVFAEPMTHLNPDNILENISDNQDIKILFKSYSMNWDFDCSWSWLIWWTSLFPND